MVRWRLMLFRDTIANEEILSNIERKRYSKSLVKEKEKKKERKKQTYVVEIEHTRHDNAFRLMPFHDTIGMKRYL